MIYMKIKNMVSNISDKVGTYINNINEEQTRIDNIINNSESFVLDKDIPENEDNIVEGNLYEYVNMCPYFSIKHARKIGYLIPIGETVLNIVDIVQQKNKHECLIVFTDRRIVVMDRHKYTEYNYEDIKSFSLVKKGFMSQLVNFNDVIMDMNAYYEEVNTLYKIVSNKEFRSYYIDEATKYLCGIKPIYQLLNQIYSGISISEDKMIVFHDKKEKNYLCKYEDIVNYELLEDATVVMERSEHNSSTTIINNNVECYTMKIKITTKDEKAFEITILEPSTFNKVYKYGETAFIKNFEFAKAIIEKLDTFKK